MNWIDEDSSMDEEPPASIEIGIADQQTLIALNEDLLTRIVELILTDAGYQTGEISIAILEDAAIHELNRQYLDHDYPTDVLSFLLEDEFPSIQGEIIASSETAIRFANDVGWDAHTELLLYLIHGTLHLIGHDDHEPGDRVAMREQERHYLIEAGIDETQIVSRLPDADDDAGPNSETPSKLDRDAKPHHSSQGEES